MEIDDLPVIRVRITAIAGEDSPRRSGEDLDHARMLAGSYEFLPPILLHRPTMRVIDGNHRLRAARLCGLQEIEARAFDGSAADAFVLAVRANVRHGLPLCLADRKAAAERILRLYPAWSDRAIARVCGLSASTVGVSRRCLNVQNGQLDSKVGRDGRFRPVDAAERKVVAQQLLDQNPGLSLREVARQARLSPETVRRLRSAGATARLAGVPARRPDLPEPRSRADQVAGRPGAIAAGRADGSALRALAADPAFRSTDSGRALLRLLSATDTLNSFTSGFVDSAPAHCMEWLATAVQSCIEQWQSFASELERKVSFI